MYTPSHRSINQKNLSLVGWAVHRRLAPPPDAYGTLRGILNPRARDQRESTACQSVGQSINQSFARPSKKRNFSRDPKVLCMDKQ